MALSEFQKVKLLAIFQTMYDSNHDGVIDRDDFTKVLADVKELHHWATNDDQCKKAEKQLEDIWEGLRKAADKNKDEKVTKEEWLEMWGKTLGKVKAGEDFPSWQEEYIKFMFLANDTSGDDNIDKDEFAQIGKVFGKTEDQCNAAWQKLSRGTDALIPYELFHELWREYFLSDDQNCRGNWLFGGLN